MNAPTTRPIDEPNEHFVKPDYAVRADRASNVTQDNSVNKYGPQILLVGILAAIGFAFGIASFVLAQSTIKELKTQFRLVDDDWQKQTAWLYAHGIARDEHGNLYIVEQDHGRR